MLNSTGCCLLSLANVGHCFGTVGPEADGDSAAGEARFVRTVFHSLIVFLSVLLPYCLLLGMTLNQLTCP